MQSLQLRVPRHHFLQPRHHCKSSRRVVLIQSLCPYQTLGVPATADDSEIKKAFRKLALQYHPDVSDSEDAHATFIAIQQAYEVLSGKARGKDIPVTQADWEWHDWYWNFCKSRNWSRNAAGKTSSETAYSKPQLNSSQSKENIRTQLAGLRHRAAIRAQSQKQTQYQDEHVSGGTCFADPGPYHASVSAQNVTIPTQECSETQHDETEVDERQWDSSQYSQTGQCGDSHTGERDRYRSTSHIPPSADPKSRIMHQLAGLKRKSAHAAHV